VSSIEVVVGLFLQPPKSNRRRVRRPIARTCFRKGIVDVPYYIYNLVAGEALGGHFHQLYNESALDYHKEEKGKTMIHSTTIICVRREGRLAMAGDGQVSQGQTILKQTARKIRRLHKDKILAGFAGATSDAFALFARFENKLEEYRGNLSRAAIELAKDWRLDKALRQLEALLIVADKDSAFLISGTGDVVEPDDGIIAIGSGGPYALAAARALIKHTSLSAKETALEALRISAGICVYTNDQILVEEL
jgi:ATP-dependent HslUV protease subunit HslV